MRQALKINLIVWLIALVAFIASRLSFPYPNYIAGLMLYFLAAFDTALVLEAICRRPFGQVKLFLWTFFLALTFEPIVLYLFYLFKGFYNPNSAFMLLTFWQIIMLAILIISKRFSRHITTTFDFGKIFADKLFWMLTGLFLIAIGVNFFLYKFNPAADPYYYLVNLNKYLSQGTISLAEDRPIFTIFLQFLTSITGISGYWLLKIVLPLMTWPLLVLFYILSRNYLKNKLLLALSACAFFLFPVVAAEILIGRSQLIFLITLPIGLYLAFEIVKSKFSYQFYGLILLLFCQLAAIKIHPLFIVSAFLTLIAVGFYLRDFYRRHTLESIFATVFLLVLFYPWLASFGLIDKITYFSNFFKNALFHPHFTLWFLNNATSVDGSTLSWPGYLAWFYYGYILGFLLPLVIIVLIVRKKKIDLNLRENWLYFIAWFLFFAIAEIFPRLGLVFLPDRAWLFAALLSSFFLPGLINKAFADISPKILIYGTAAMFIATITVSWMITYRNGGWINSQEYLAAKWMKNSLPQNALIISQPGNNIMIEYFANRQIVVPPADFFLAANQEEKAGYLADLPAKINQKEKIDTQISALQDSIISAINAPQTATTPSEVTTEENQLIACVTQKLQQIKILKQKSISLPSAQTISEQPVYILYSQDKFVTYYASHQWWRDYNFYGANLQNFDTPGFGKVYDSGGVKIWKYLKG